MESAFCLFFFGGRRASGVRLFSRFVVLNLTAFFCTVEIAGRGRRSVILSFRLMVLVSETQQSRSSGSGDRVRRLRRRAAHACLLSDSKVRNGRSAWT
mgnify:CR=1 FL=1